MNVQRMMLCAAMCFVAMIVACEAEDPTGGATPTPTTMKFNVEGMHCNSCAMTIAGTLKTLDGVESCDVSYENGLATLNVWDPTIEPQIVGKISELDFTASRIE